MNLFLFETMKQWLLSSFISLNNFIYIFVSQVSVSFVCWKLIYLGNKPLFLFLKQENRMGWADTSKSFYQISFFV